MFRFTIRDVLWLTVVVGLLLGWLVHAVSWTKFHNNVWLELNDTIQDVQAKLWEADGERLGLDFKNRQLQAEIDGRNNQLRTLLKLDDDAKLPDYSENLRYLRQKSN